MKVTARLVTVLSTAVVLIALTQALSVGAAHGDGDDPEIEEHEAQTNMTDLPMRTSTLSGDHGSSTVPEQPEEPEPKKRNRPSKGRHRKPRRHSRRRHRKMTQRRSRPRDNVVSIAAIRPRPFLSLRPRVQSRGRPRRRNGMRRNWRRRGGHRVKQPPPSGEEPKIEEEEEIAIFEEPEESEDDDSGDTSELKELEVEDGDEQRGGHRRGTAESGVGEAPEQNLQNDIGDLSNTSQPDRRALNKAMIRVKSKNSNSHWKLAPVRPRRPAGGRRRPGR